MYTNPIPITGVCILGAVWAVLVCWKCTSMAGPFDKLGLDGPGQAGAAKRVPLRPAWMELSWYFPQTQQVRPARPDSSSKPGDPRRSSPRPRVHPPRANLPPPDEILHLRSPPPIRGLPPLRRCKRRSTPPPQSSRRSPNPHPHPHPFRLPPPRTLSDTNTATAPFHSRRRRPS